MAPCFHGTLCETPEAFSNLLRFSRCQRKLRISASLLENLGALSSCLSAFSISARSSLRLPLVSV
jgi:hypothetical protein